MAFGKRKKIEKAWSGHMWRKWILSAARANKTIEIWTVYISEIVNYAYQMCSIAYMWISFSFLRWTITQTLAKTKYKTPKV